MKVIPGWLSSQDEITLVNTALANPRGGLAATFDLAAFALYMFAPVKKSVNHSKTLTSMREVQRSLARTTREVKRLLTPRTFMFR